MEISPTTIREFLQSIAHAVSQKETRNYDDLLRMILEDHFLPPAQLQPSLDKLPSEIFLGRDDAKKILLSKLICEEFGYRSSNQSEKSPSALPAKDRTEVTHCSVIKIAGGSGMGKTALARVVYENIIVEEYFDLRVWVKLEEKELDLGNAARGILRSVMGMPCAVDELAELDEMVRDILQGQRCLLVIDGIKAVSKDSWLHMKQCWFDFLDLRSKVLITTPTPREDVGCLPLHEIELLPLIPSISCALASHMALDSFNNETEKDILGRLVTTFVPGSGGIPLLLKLLGCLFRYDGKIADLFCHIDLLPSIWNESSTILLCVWSLPPRLRQCLAYCTLFPKGYALNKEKMIHLWSANGVLDIGDGDACFHHLLSRSFFTDITRDHSNNVIEFRIPSLFHEILEDVATIIYREKLGSLGLISFAGEDAARISLAGGYEADHLRTLILSPILYVGGNLDHSLVCFVEVISLDLSCSGIHSLSGSICVLKKLKYLNLSYTLIENLPDSITRLSLLQTLDLSWCYHLKFLPRRLRDLTLMSHLDLSQCGTLSHFPSGILSLRSLSSMPLFVLGEDYDSARLRELGPLNQLKGRLEIRNLENVREVLEAQDAKLDEKILQTLELSWSQSEEEDDDDLCFQVLQFLRPNQQLEVLGLRGYMGFEFPRWISSMKNLVKISITDCGCVELPSLGQLPLLKELQLRGMAKLRHIGPEFYGNSFADVDFQSSLERLEVYDLPSLLTWYGDERAFLSLKFVRIEGCPQLRSLPRFPTLHDLIVSISNNCDLHHLPYCTSFLISGTEVRDLIYVPTFGALKKLIFHNIPDMSIDLMRRKTFPALEHLGILHCNKLKFLYVYEFPSLKKLHVVNCRRLLRILVRGKADLLMELVVEDCPQVRTDFFFHELDSLRKLIVRNCSDQFTIYNGDTHRRLRRLEYLSVNGCPGVERELQAYPDLISHIPVVIVGNHNAKYQGKKKKKKKKKKQQLF